ncbi:MAG: hypothetical protein K6C10_05460 [Prevotella sp.]|nr:hypothetical protein [Prevotella sp.]
MKFHYLSAAFVAILALVAVTSCNGKKTDKPSASQLIEEADHFQVDTITADPSDTLVSASADAVLRHYPELYRAVQSSQKIYDKWSEQEKSALKTNPSLLNVSDIVSEALSASEDQQTKADDSPAADDAPTLSQAMEKADGLYLHLISEAPAEQKSAIGHSRKAFMAYLEQLQTVAQAIPEKLQSRYNDVLMQHLQHFLNDLKNLSNNK